MGEKYIIDIEKTPHRSSRGHLLWSASAFNTLVFDEEGMSRLKPLADEIAKAYKVGTEVAAVCGGDEMRMLLRALGAAFAMNDEERLRNYGYSSFQSVLSWGRPQEIIEKYRESPDATNAVPGDILFFKEKPEIRVWVTKVSGDGQRADGLAICSEWDNYDNIDLREWQRTGENSPIWSIIGKKERGGRGD